MVLFINLLGKGLTQEINGDRGSIWWAPDRSQTTRTGHYHALKYTQWKDDFTRTELPKFWALFGSIIFKSLPFFLLAVFFSKLSPPPVFFEAKLFAAKACCSWSKKPGFSNLSSFVFAQNVFSVKFFMLICAKGKRKFIDLALEYV